MTILVTRIETKITFYFKKKLKARSDQSKALSCLYYDLYISVSGYPNTLAIWYKIDLFETWAVTY